MTLCVQRCSSCARPQPLQDPTLQELYLSQTGLSGPLPDVVPTSSPLRLLYAINFIQPERTGLTGAAVQCLRPCSAHAESAAASASAYYANSSRTVYLVYRCL
jgi:hypothetical protein